MTQIKLDINDTSRKMIEAEGIEDFGIDADGNLWLSTSDHDGEVPPGKFQDNE